MLLIITILEDYRKRVKSFEAINEERYRIAEAIRGLVKEIINRRTQKEATIFSWNKFFNILVADIRHTKSILKKTK